MQLEHKTVLLHETIDGLSIADGDVIVDMTLGGAGHTEEALKTGAKNLTIIGIDADSEAVKRAETKLSAYQQEENNSENPQSSNGHRIILETGYFDTLDEILERNQITKINKVIFDLGYSSYEIDDGERGFSFLHEGPLKMTYTNDPLRNQLTAYDVVNSFEEENLADVIYGFGEEKFSRRIARGIVEARNRAPIMTTTELASIISRSVPGFYRHHKEGGRSKIHPATKTFQAIRITVNSELERLKIGLAKSFDALDAEGRIAVISFHSLEDRIVKKFFRKKADENQAELINKKPIIPTDAEIIENPRARSAKLRIIQKNNY